MKYRCLNCLDYFTTPDIKIIEDIDYGDTRKLKICPLCGDERIEKILVNEKKENHLANEEKDDG